MQYPREGSLAAVVLHTALPGAKTIHHSPQQVPACGAHGACGCAAWPLPRAHIWQELCTPLWAGSELTLILPREQKPFLSQVLSMLCYHSAGERRRISACRGNSRAGKGTIFIMHHLYPPHIWGCIMYRWCSNAAPKGTWSCRRGDSVPMDVLDNKLIKTCCTASYLLNALQPVPATCRMLL